ncbi:hypothetical protein [Snuella sedimenti]|uniref:Uncharacterized protein n=1 Tax=Snuella sedimenti TaxID=2798802 RepID=A0A8J7IFB1_9FLAO|nr:hypothetical protein [Snuella sedimenti]MBJ6367622.1 hypothetical protein [Snuella sedimenti]
MNRYKKLVLCLFLDAIGYISFLIPGFGEFSDVVWAPVSAWLMTKLYKGRAGKIAAVVSFVEELMPGVDVVPTFTLMWLYVHVFSSKSTRIRA